MRRLLVSAAVLGLISSTATLAAPDPSSTVTTNADATIITPIQVTQDGNPLSFGKIAAPVTATGAYVDVNSTGGLTGSPAGLVVAGSTGSVPTYTVSGLGTQAYTVTLNDTAWGSTLATAVPVTLTRGGGSETMIAHVFKSGGSSALTAGSDTFKAVGRLDVGAGQVPGSYTGTFNITVFYN